jgi:hypothetical protein
MFCPCWFGVPELAVQDQGYCASALAFRIQEGTSEEVDLSGRTVVFVAYFPELMFNGGGTGRLYLEESASAEQRRELEAIFSGARGGPMAGLVPLFSTWLPARTAAIAVNEGDDTVTVSVANAGEVVSRRLRDPEGKAFSLQGGGFLTALQVDALDLAPSASRWTDADLPIRFETRSGGRSIVRWRG